MLTFPASAAGVVVVVVVAGGAAAVARCDRYCAPEIFKDPCRFGPPVDVWALGVIVVQFVTGVHPFAELSGKNFNDVYDHPRLIARLNTFELDPHFHSMASKCSPQLVHAAQRMLQVGTCTGHST